jgi:hypothetical protein
MDEELYIRMLNGRPVDHPMLRSNLESAFPDVDFNNLPDWLARFERVAQPRIAVYEVATGPVYVIDGDQVRDQWVVRAMTDDEILIKQNIVKQTFAYDQPDKVASWSFQETTCSYTPPTPYPTDGLVYDWHELSQTWIPLPPPLLPEIIVGQDGTQRKPYPLSGTHRWDETINDWVFVNNDPVEAGTFGTPPPSTE